jgi:hypothetical protein
VLVLVPGHVDDCRQPDKKPNHGFAGQVILPT